MSQAFAESHVGVWKRRFATWVRARMDAVGEDNEESKRAKTIKQSWPDVADTITAAVNTAWMRKHPRPLSRFDVHFGSTSRSSPAAAVETALSGASVLGIKIPSDGSLATTRFSATHRQNPH